MARFRRTRSESSRMPSRSPSFERRTVVLLSTINRLASRSPLLADGAMSRRNKGASVGSVVNGQIVTESVSKRSSWIMAAGRGLPASSAPPATVQISARLNPQARWRPSRRTLGHHSCGRWQQPLETADVPPPRIQGRGRQAPRSGPVADLVRVSALDTRAPGVGTLDPSSDHHLRYM